MKAMRIPMSMLKRDLVTAMLFLGAAAASAAGPPEEVERYWPQWRGPLASGVAPHGSPPAEWGGEKNVRYKAAVPGSGKGTPVIWGERLYLTTAIPTDRTVPVESVATPRAAGGFRHPQVSPETRYQRFAVLALDRKTGDTLWSRSVREALPHEGKHEYGTFASMSAATDGERVYAFFGSQGLFCLDLGGTVLWEKDFGDMVIRLGFGEGASPVLYGDTIIVSWDHEGDSFIVALDKVSGKELWRTDRDEMTSWATPLVVEHDGLAQVVVSATRRVRSYDLRNGELIWETGGMTMNPIPMPVHSDGIVYLTSGFRGNALLAIALDAARGDVSESEAIVWQHDRDTPYVPSPLLYEDTLYVIKRNSNVFSAFDAKTGRAHYQTRLEGIASVFASPVGADGRIYITGREGTTVVLEAGPEPKVLATNHLDDAFDASMAVAGNEIYLRGQHHLYRISKD